MIGIQNINSPDRQCELPKGSWNWNITMNKFLKGLIFDRPELCRICFSNPVTEDDLRFHDEVVLNHHTIKISTMLTYILGGKLASTMSSQDVVCSSCTEQIKNSYNFIQMIKNNSVCLENTVDTITESLKMPKENIKLSKSVLIQIDCRDNSFMQFYHYRRNAQNLPIMTLKSNWKSNRSKYIMIPKEIEGPLVPRTERKRRNRQQVHFDTEMQESGKDLGLSNEQNVMQKSDNLNTTTALDKLKVQDRATRAGSRKHILKQNVTVSAECKRNKKDEPYNLKEIKESKSRAGILELKYKCKECGKRFPNAVRLKSHTRVHTGERPFVCEHCDMAFKYDGARRDHIRSQHLVPSIQCDICLGVFKSLAILHKHRKKHFESKSKLHFSYYPLNYIPTL